jgi:flagellar biosynthesis protein
MRDAGEDRFRRAVALRYDPGKDGAPRVTAKGSRAIAERIIQLAKEEGVPLHEDSDLVAALMELDFQEQIPPQLYKAVAEILAFVYRLNKAHKAHGA